jgi:hypothetical protein
LSLHIVFISFPNTLRGLPALETSLVVNRDIRPASLEVNL